MDLTELPTLLEENVKRIDEAEAFPYLNRLSSRLSNLSEILKREGNEFVIPYLEIVKNSIDCLTLKYEIKGEDKIDFSLTIDPSDSGFPTVKDFYLLEKNKGEAKEILEQLPGRDEIIDKIRKAILRGDSPINWQIVLKRYNFYTKLSKSKVLKEYHLNEPKFIKEENGRRFYTQEWSCIEMAKNIPVFYRMCFTQDRRHPSLEEAPNYRLETLIYQTKLSMINLQSFAALADREIEEVHPKFIERYEIGPYYDSLTTNSPAFSQIFNGIENPSALKFTVDRVLSEKVQKYGNWIDRLCGRKTEREIFGPVDSEMKIIVPFRVKQKLGDNNEYINEYGKTCKVYGVTSDGGVI